LDCNFGQKLKKSQTQVDLPLGLGDSLQAAMEEQKANVDINIVINNRRQIQYVKTTKLQHLHVV